jgi:hypothetical protein
MEKAKRDVIAVRATEEFRQQIDDAAAQAGRSMSQEIEARLRDSFEADRAHGGGEQAEVVRRMASIMNFVSRRFGVSWMHDEAGFDVVVEALDEMLAGLRPSERVEPERLERSERVAAALARYAEEYASWKRDRDATLIPPLKVFTKARSGKPVSAEERAAATEARELRAHLPPEPTPDLSADELRIWRLEHEFDERARVTRDAALAMATAHRAKESK